MPLILSMTWRLSSFHFQKMKRSKSRWIINLVYPTRSSFKKKVSSFAILNEILFSSKIDEHMKQSATKIGFNTANVWPPKHWKRTYFHRFMWFSKWTRPSTPVSDNLFPGIFAHSSNGHWTFPGVLGISKQRSCAPIWQWSHSFWLKKQ